MNSTEPLSRYGQIANDITIQREKWIDAIVEDQRASVLDTVAVRIDARQWISTLSPRTKRIARDLGVGFSTSEVARIHGLTAGRISQLRGKLRQSWLEFQHESVPTLAQ